MQAHEWRKIAAKLDSRDMYGKIIEFPKMMRKALEICSTSEFLFQGKIENIVGCGMGGSGIGIELARDWLMSDLKTPFEVIRNYSLPGYVNERTLLYVASYSGNTEEAISCLKKGFEARGNVFAVSSGGDLYDLSMKLGVKHLTLPAGYLPREAFPFLFVPLVWLLAKSGLAPACRLAELEECIPLLEATAERYKMDVEEDENEAKSLSKKIDGRFPIIYGHGVMGAIATRFKQQLNENAKVYASKNDFPELNHNELEGFRFLSVNEPLVMILRYKGELRQISKRIKITKELLKAPDLDIVELWGEGETEISQALTMMLKLDMASFYLSLIQGVDPSPTPRISKLKSELGKS